VGRVQTWILARRDQPQDRRYDPTVSARRNAIKLLLLKPALFLNSSFLYTARLELACARGALNVGLRQVDPKNPRTWEFSAFSQNGEDGIIDYLLSGLRSPNRYFVEIGASDGLENNTSYLAFVKRYDGVMVEGDPFLAANAERFLQAFNWGVRYLNLVVLPDTVSVLIDECVYRDPDFFSLDIDGNDFYVAKACLEGGLRPKVLCVEYNSAFGPIRSTTVPYDPNFAVSSAHPSYLYYGVSLMAWKALLGRYGYRFVTVDSRGINAFFVDPATIKTDLVEGIQRIEFAENSTQRMRFKEDWRGQFARISDMPLVEVTSQDPQTVDPEANDLR
jgi:hypothetical protein